MKVVENPPQRLHKPIPSPSLQQVFIEQINESNSKIPQQSNKKISSLPKFKMQISNPHKFLKNKNNNQMPMVGISSISLLPSLNPEQISPRPLSVNRQSTFLKPVFISQNNISRNNSIMNSINTNNNRKNIKVSFSYQSKPSSFSNLHNNNNNLHNNRMYSYEKRSPYNYNSHQNISYLSKIVKNRKNIQNEFIVQENKIVQNNIYSSLSQFVKKNGEGSKLQKKKKAFNNNANNMSNMSNMNNINNNNNIVSSQIQQSQYVQLKLQANNNNNNNNNTIPSCNNNQTNSSSIQLKQKSNQFSLQFSGILSQQKSQYVYLDRPLAILKQKQFTQNIITPSPQQYIYSQQQISLGKRIQSSLLSVNNSKNMDNINGKKQYQKILIIPIQQQTYSEFQISQKMDKSPKRINNKVYIDGDNNQNNNIGELKKISTIQSRVSDGHKKSRITIKQKEENSNNNVNVNNNVNNNNKVEQQRLLSLQPRLQKYLLQSIQQLKKQLLIRNLQTQSLKTQIQQIKSSTLQSIHNNNNNNFSNGFPKQFSQLQMKSKLNQIEIKKLQNQLKMFRIKQKVFQNKEEQYLINVKELKNQMKTIRNSLWKSNQITEGKRKGKYQSNNINNYY